MRILFTIAHFFNPNTNGKHGSQRKDPRPRILALGRSLAALHQLFSKSQSTIHIGQRLAFPANQPQSYELDVIICTTQNNHLLNQLPLPAHLYQHYPTKAEPLMLGFECQALLRDCLGKYDYYCFLEDDLILHDPWLFIKLNWFTQGSSSECQGEKKISRHNYGDANCISADPQSPLWLLFFEC